MAEVARIFFYAVDQFAGIERRAVRGGAFEYLTKPFDLPQVQALVEKARTLRSLRGEVAELDRKSVV